MGHKENTKGFFLLIEEGKSHLKLSYIQFKPIIVVMTIKQGVVSAKHALILVYQSLFKMKPRNKKSYQLAKKKVVLKDCHKLKYPIIFR